MVKSDEPPSKQTLSHDLGLARSTVDEVTRNLCEMGLLKPTADSVVPTLFVVLVWKRYESFMQCIAKIGISEGDTALWPTEVERQEVMQLVAARLDVLERAQTPHDKRDLVADLTVSRSTVDRALRELEMAELIAWTKEGYVTTAAGKQAVKQYRITVESISDILAAREVLSELPYDCPIPFSLLADAAVEYAADAPPYHLPAGVRDRIVSAQRVHIYLPVLATPQLLDCCQQQVIHEGMTLELLISSPLLETLSEEFPGSLGAMAAVNHCTAFATDTVPDLLPFGVMIAETDTTTSVSVIVYGENHTIHGTIHNESTDAVQWAEEKYAYICDGAADVTDELRALLPAKREMVTGGVSINDTERIALESEGFIQLTPEYFAQRAPSPPMTGWRTGFDLVDVHAGYAIDREREHNGARQSLTDDLVARLEGGSDHALIGLPGSGKSTVCRSVACRWYEQGEGTVFYRKSGIGMTFDSPEILSAQLRAAVSEGHVLVVVEDAVRAEANTIFRVMKAFQENESVSFLVDARTSEWNDPSMFPADARLDAYRTETIETVTMPTFNERECERLVDRFQETTDHRVDISATHLIRGSEDEYNEGLIYENQANQPAELLLVLHRLTLHSDPLVGDTSQTPTSLIEDVQRTYKYLRADGDMVLDVGVLVNLLNAADLRLQPALVYALAETDDEVMAVHDALTALEDRSIFVREAGATDDSYRVVHEAWSELFLAHLLDTAGEYAASHRVGRCITALLALADDDARRERCIMGGERGESVINQIEEAPTEWTDTTIERLFHLGLNCPKLAPLFGTTEHSSVELPAACSSEMEPRCAALRGRMYFQAGNRDWAEHELNRAVGLVDDAGISHTDRGRKVKALCHKHLGSVALRRGRIAAAEDLYRRALNSYREIGDRLGEATCHNNLGIVVYAQRDLEHAAEYFERSLTIRREIGASRKHQICPLNNLGVAVSRRGDFDRAEKYLEQSIEIGRDLGGHFRMGRAFYSLAVIERWRGNLDRAERHCKRGLDAAQDAGVSDLKALGLLNLGIITLEHGNLDCAEEHIQRSLDIWSETENIQYRAMGRLFFGVIMRKRGDFAAATTHLTEALSLCRDGHPYGEAKTLIELGETARAQGNVARASERFETAIALYREMGAVRDAIESVERLTAIPEIKNETETIRAHHEMAVTLAQEAEFDVSVSISEHRAVDDTDDCDD